jgi:phosphopantetheinyl transferase
LRSELARVTGKPAHTLALTRGSQGKPALMGGPQFNISHSAGWLALAISQDVPLGIDIEARAPRAVDPLRLAQRFFTAAESRALAGLPTREQLAQFYALWTLKEAFSKSLGEPVVEHLTRLDIEYRPSFLSVRHDGLQTRASLALYPLQGDACLAICVSDHPGHELQCTPQLSIGAPLQNWCRISPRGTGTRLFSHLATV